MRKTTVVFFFQAEDGIRNHFVMEFRLVLFQSENNRKAGQAKRYKELKKKVKQERENYDKKSEEIKNMKKGNVNVLCENENAKAVKEMAIALQEMARALKRNETSINFDTCNFTSNDSPAFSVE